MLKDHRPPPVLTAGRRCLFPADRQQSATLDDNLQMAMEIEQELLARKRDQWSFDFVNGTPVDEELSNNNWQWEIIVE
ncbi:uncharacterized protein LOC100568919 isoform X3 [Acyrthosiphon pisum]|uniref:Cyclin-dependent kinase inhibitor domain-containing protein n=1 Tax=Acyrthosiphon pisum TaxID=7029 RepID=A0A8R1W931_ACYPI|nr:uncharacterized protein LOC100568919 isoform X3 [Acyrthosiphon pisum]XP_008180841.1 uncharacterized protein LOC100568919 isoform X3 [Acyrthosiphon pisum]|eukprot:XP_003243054.1 PREDICTED: uncharacterized protein LOC100568919 isoform X3 [Acyrthosiphon pisum]